MTCLGLDDDVKTEDKEEDKTETESEDEEEVKTFTDSSLPPVETMYIENTQEELGQVFS